MKFLSNIESESWFLSHDITRDFNFEGGWLEFGENSKTFLTTVPSKRADQTELARILIDWVSPQPDLLIWFHDWSTYADENLANFQKKREALGEDRWLINSRGHLFTSTDDLKIAEDFTLDILGYCWQAYIISSGSRDYVLIGDDYMCFGSFSREKLELGKDLIRAFGLLAVEDIQEAWFRKGRWGQYN